MQITSKLVDEGGRQLNAKVMELALETCRAGVFSKFASLSWAEDLFRSQSALQDEFDKNKSILDKAESEISACLAKDKETRQLHAELAAGVPADILNAQPVTPPGRKDGGTWLRWYKAGPKHMTFDQFDAAEAAKKASKAEDSSTPATKTISSSAPRLTGPRPANVIQGAFWRLAADANTPKTSDVVSAELAVGEVSEYMADLKVAQGHINTSVTMAIGNAFQDMPELERQLAKTKAQLAAAQQEVEAAKARAAAAEAALQRLQQQPPITLAVSVVQPSVTLNITIQEPQAQQQSAQQQEASSVPAVPQQPAEPKQVAAQEVEEVQPRAPELQQTARSTAAVGDAELAQQQQQQVKAAGSAPAAPAAQGGEQATVKQPVTPPAAAGSPANALSPRESVSDSDTAANSSTLGALWGQITDAVAAVSASSVSAFSWSSDDDTQEADSSASYAAHHTAIIAGMLW